MGGANSGALASTLAAGAYLERLRSLLSGSKKNAVLAPLWMRDACTAANEAVFSRAAADSSDAGMGTTLVSAVVVGHRAEVINVGDSRAYLISRRANSIRQITRDHSYVGELMAAGALTPEQARNHPKKNVLMRALGCDARVECDYFTFTLQKGEILLLCSDGLSNIVSDLEMLEYAREFPEPEALCRSLMSKALNRGAKDNVTIVTIMR
jgi:protein phosphatase